MTTNTISMQYDLSKEDLICSVCLDEITFPVIQCTNGNHFVCLTCFRELNRKCPVCRTGRLFHNKFIQTKLEPSMVSCSNQNCDKKVLPWSKDSHQESTLLTMLRTEHIPLNMYLGQRDPKQERSKWCPCGQGRETVRHVILACPIHARQRFELRKRLEFENIENISVNDLRTDPKQIPHLLAFIRSTKRLKVDWKVK